MTGHFIKGMDSVPIVALTGQVPTTMLGNDAFQESDIQGITMPVTKHNYLVKDTADIPRVVKEAFYIAGTGRQGPVLIDLPKDVNTRSIKEPLVPEKVVLRGYNPTYKGNKRQIDKAIALITAAERPLIYAGGGVISSNASPELVEFATKLGIPVTTTLMGIGCIPCDHPLNLGMLGMHGGDGRRACACVPPPVRRKKECLYPRPAHGHLFCRDKGVRSPDEPGPDARLPGP